MDGLESFLGKIALKGNIRVLALQAMISQLGFIFAYGALVISIRER